MNEADIHPHVPAEMAHLFSSEDSQATEDEYTEFLYGFVRATKPRRILETGCHEGKATTQMGMACRNNDRGRVHAIDLSQSRLNIAAAVIHESGLDEYVSFHQEDSLSWLRKQEPSDMEFDLAFFDSDLPLRPEEFSICLQRKLLRPGAFAIFHDSSRRRINRAGNSDPRATIFWREIEHLQQFWGFGGRLELPLSRGMLIISV